MKKTLFKALLIAPMMVMALMTIFVYGQLQKRVDFSISAPFALRMGEYILPPGNYVLRQVLHNDLNLFALHPGDLTQEPIAMIRTTRIDFQSTNNYPDDTRLFIELDEASQDSHPVVQGWTIPGMDGWEVISVVEKKSGMLKKVDGDTAGNNRYKLDQKKLSNTKYGDNDRRRKIQFKRMDN